jgi:pimeloyl-ACP methyl ester carboxylesterase
MAFLDRSGVSLHVQELSSEGPPLVMLHGLLVGSMATWYFGAGPKLARRFHVVLGDLRGHGLSSPAATGYDLATLGLDLHAQLQLAGSGSVSLVGHSYGALVALRYALAHPGRVRQLAIIDAPLPPSRVPDLEAFLSKSPEDMVTSLPPALAENIASGGRQGRRLLAQLQRLVQQSSLLADIAAEPDFTDEELARIDIPVLLVYGDRSGCRPAGERLARTLPKARLRILPGGHFLPSDQPALLANLLEEELYHG